MNFKTIHRSQVKNAMNRSRERYFSRKKKFKGFKGKIEHHILWMIHNCIAHPVLGIYVCNKTLKFHDNTSALLNESFNCLNQLSSQYYVEIYETYYPRLNYKFRWFLHNSIIHFFLGLFPCKFMFKLHDITAKYMDEPDWV